jgi:hypothetical protein
VLILLSWKPVAVENPATASRQTLEATQHPPPAILRILRRSCYDCHSNDTHWPWYAHLRPIAGWLNRDIAAARSAINFSEWSAQTQGDEMLQQRSLHTSCSLMEAGMMPPSSYLYFHPNAKPSGAEVREFCGWVNTAGLAR